MLAHPLLMTHRVEQQLGTVGDAAPRIILLSIYNSCSAMDQLKNDKLCFEIHPKELNLIL
jgi:hypothetical protein